MKRNYIFSGLIALIVSVSSFGILNHFTKPQKAIKIEHVAATPAKSAVYSINDKGDVIPLDFHETAKNVLDGVVHIKSTHLRSQNDEMYQYRSLPDPFKDFFNDRLEKRFFFPNNNVEKNRNTPAKVGSGSGVIISDDGYIVTNNHVIENADDIEITLHDNRTYKASIVGVDPSTDLALLRIKENNLPTVPLTDSDNVKIGQWVLAVGNPMGLNSTVTAGIISAKGRNINILKDKYAVENFIQTDAAINPGNSGGALVNLNGGLVGINTAIASPTGSFAGYGFAVPANIVEKVVEDLMQYGTVQRGVLGIMIKTVNSQLAKEKSLDLSKGVYVDSLFDNSAALSAGIKEGDVIVKVNDLPIETSQALQGIIAQHRPGEEVNVVVNRNGKEKSYTVKLNSREGDTKTLSKQQGEILKILGITVEDLDKETLKANDISQGVMVKKIFPGKIRKQTQMEDGFIITKLNSKRVKNIDSLLKMLKDESGGVMLEGIYDNLPGTYFYAFGLNNN